MPLFEPITTEQKLPRINQGHEHTSLDAKVSARKGGNAPPAPFDLPELAKDMAAFANAIGGTILIGAHEATGVIDRYEALSDVEATETLNAYNGAATSFCSPRPLIVPARIAHASGVVLAINVSPFIGQLVGVSRDGIGHRGRTFNFPYRVGNGTDWTEPEQHAMFMIPSIRRTVVLLEGIPSGARISISTTQSAPGPGYVKLMAVDVYKNVAVFAKEANRSPLHVALDDIERVWMDANGEWRIRLVLHAPFY